MPPFGPYSTWSSNRSWAGLPTCSSTPLDKLVTLPGPIVESLSNIHALLHYLIIKNLTWFIFLAIVRLSSWVDHVWQASSGSSSALRPRHWSHARRSYNPGLPHQLIDGPQILHRPLLLGQRLFSSSFVLCAFRFLTAFLTLSTGSSSSPTFNTPTLPYPTTARARSTFNAEPFAPLTAAFTVSSFTVLLRLTLPITCVPRFLTTMPGMPQLPWRLSWVSITCRRMKTSGSAFGRATLSVGYVPHLCLRF